MVAQFWCMPQGKRTASEKFEFDVMLKSIADLYLTTRVLILLDMTYIGRFWPSLEAWCSMQTATQDGLRPSTQEEKRYEIACILNAKGKHSAHDLLVESLASLTPDQITQYLAKPDVVLTNAKDKETMLPVISSMYHHVKEVFDEAPAGSKSAAAKLEASKRSSTSRMLQRMTSQSAKRKGSNRASKRSEVHPE